MQEIIFLTEGIPKCNDVTQETIGKSDIQIVSKFEILLSVASMFIVPVFSIFSIFSTLHAFKCKRNHLK